MNTLLGPVIYKRSYNESPMTYNNKRNFFNYI